MPESFRPLISYNRNMPLTREQQTLLNAPLSSKIFLYGPAGSGKTTAGTVWLRKLLESGIPAHEILIFVPQRALAAPYQESLLNLDQVTNSLVNTVTIGGLARRMVDLFWPIASKPAGVAQPNLPPNFLTLETAQYYMAHLVRSLIEEQGFFDSLTINRNRIYSQILDNLNKSAIVGFPLEEIGERLKSAWIGDASQLRIYDDVQFCASRFRNFCLENNLLDFSLQVEIFIKYLWPSPLCRQHLTQSYRHLIVDNIEEDTPVTHDILHEWIPDFESALVIYDTDAGYRFFLGADVQSAFSVRKTCKENIQFTGNLVSSSGISQIKDGVQNAITRLIGEPPQNPQPSFDSIQSAMRIPEEKIRYFPAMVKWVAGKIKDLVDEGVPPGEIVVLAPFMPDVLRFSLSNQLDKLDIPNQSHRPSRSLRDEPATQTMLTLATLAFPEWDMLPKRINLAFALMQVIEGLDLVRAQLLTAYVYHPESEDCLLQPFESVPPQHRDRITYRVGQRYDMLRSWLEAARQDENLALDFFLNRLFGEVLSQPGFGFHNNLNNGNTIANLIESIQKFRWAVGAQMPSDIFSIGKEYVQMVQDGVIAAQYIQSWEEKSEDAVFLAPAYTFLISNRPVDVQFWLDIGSPSWYQRLDQPLTHPYVLSRHWEKDEKWDAEDEIRAAYETLSRMSLGLLNRCREKLYLGMSELDVRGYENRGLLIRIIHEARQNARRGES